MKKKIDIATMYAKDLVKTKGSKYYSLNRNVKPGNISPKDFGEFLNRRK